MKSRFALKLLCVVLALMLLCGCGAQPGVLMWPATSFAAPEAEPEGEQEQKAQEEVTEENSEATLTMTREDITTYYGSLTNTGTTPLYFKNGNRQIPYMDLETIRELMMEKNSRDSSSLPADIPAYDLKLETKGAKAVFTRENSYTMEMDFDTDTIRFIDYDMFLLELGKITITDIVSQTGYDSQGRPCLFQRVKDSSYDRYGELFTLNLADYDIDMVYLDGNYYIPMQTFADILLQGAAYLIYNENELFMTNSNEAVSFASGNPSEILERYYDSPVKERSQELIDYTYNELCFALDNFYGLKELHGIDSFDDYFNRILVGDKSMKEMLLSSDPRDYDVALAQLMNRDLDDVHSAYLLPGSYTGNDSTVRTEVSRGISNQNYVSMYQEYTLARKARYPDGVPGYEEVGNTAYVTFDNFIWSGSEEDYYENFPTAEAQDTLGLIIYAHSRIMREGSPIKNVVIDLSCNGGGTVDAAVFVCAWFLGETRLYLEQANTGASGCTAYRCDLNLDREFDEKDTLQGKNLYCLISPLSFSCGNLTPAVFAASNQVTLVGQNSGGGTCAVLAMTTASGSMFQTSSPISISVIKNGAYYDVDEGASPDIPLTKIESFYDRVSLTAYLNSRL